MAMSRAAKTVLEHSGLVRRVGACLATSLIGADKASYHALREVGKATVRGAQLAP